MHKNYNSCLHILDMHIERGETSYFEKHSKIFFSETVKGIKHVLCINVPDSGIYIICVFYSRRIRTLVAMTT